MAPKLLVLLCTLPMLAVAMQKRATTEKFGLYGYGKGISGLPVFYADGFAYLGEANRSNSTDAAAVEFSQGTDDAWIGAPNATESSWSNATLFVPSAGSTDKRVGFRSSNDTSDDGVITSGFFLYGSTASLVGSDGQLKTLWSALPVSETVFALYWNDTSSDQIPVNLRSKAPSNPSR